MNAQAKELTAARVVNALRRHIDALLIATADAEALRGEYVGGAGSECRTIAAMKTQVQVERAMIATAEPYFPGMTNTLLDGHALELRGEYLGLLTSLVVSSPGYRNPLTEELVCDG